MFKEERRDSNGWSGCCVVLRWVALVVICVDVGRGDAPAEQAVADEASSGVAIATDIDEPAGFVPHGEELLEPEVELEFPADDALVEAEGEGAPASEPPSKPSLAQPFSIDGDEETPAPDRPLREPNPFADKPEALGPEEIGEVQEWIEAAHALAKEATSRTEYTAVIDLCQQGQESTRWSAGRRYFRSLAAWAHNRRGEDRIREGEEAAALRDFEQAVKLDPRNWRAVHNRAVSYAQQGELDVALLGFGHVIRLQPRYGPAYRNRGEVHYELGQYAEAVEDYSRALQHMPNEDDLLYLRADANRQLGKLEEALSDYDASLQANIRPERLVGRAGVHAQLGDYGAAIADLNRAIKTDSQYAEAYRAVAWILATCPDSNYRRPEKALLAARHALKLQGNSNPLYYDTLAAAYAAAGNFNQAKVIQQRAIKLAEGQKEQRAMQVRLTLYSQSRSLVSDPDVPKRQSRPQPAGRNRRANGPAGIRQPLRLGGR